MALSCARRSLDKALAEKKIMESMVKHCNKLPRKMVKLLSLEVFKNVWMYHLGKWFRVDVCDSGLMFELDLFQY